uniref:Carboxylesterase type B domain-containing protein n=1 Tax=Strigamia maritima TaxID=126957 RepID=T1IUK3_STRMM
MTTGDHVLVVVIAGTGTKFKEMHTQGEEKETIQHLLTGVTAVDSDTKSHVVIKPASEFNGSAKKSTSRWNIRRDALICTLAVVALGLLFLVILVIVLVLRGSIHEQHLIHADPSIKVITTCGPVAGTSIDGAFAFFGIPYAVPPVEYLRFKKSIPLTKMEDCWQGTYRAYQQRAHCFQSNIDGIEGFRKSEDCLYLDIYTPEASFKDPLPVVVYFRGETSLGHDKFSIRLQPSAKLAKDMRVVFVSVSYRIHAFGFMALKVLRKGHPRTSGNYGLYDMLASLKWVQMNIDAFGGNPRSVTVLGHGFGASAILALVMSETAIGLFNKAWISGGSAEIVNATLKQAEETNMEFLENIQCKTHHCLSLKSPQDIISATPWTDNIDLPFNNEIKTPKIVSDGHIVPTSLMKSLRRNKYNDVSLIFGATNYAVDADLAHDAIANYLLKNEPVSLQYSKMIADVRIRCPLFLMARVAYNKFTNDVFIYSSSHRPTSQLRFDIAAIFGQMEEFLGRHMTPEDMIYQRSMKNLFYTYIKTNKLGSVAVDGIHPPSYIDVGNGLKVHAKDSKCDLWLKSNIYQHYARHD